MASGFRAIEFYSGIGGLHQALMQSGLSPPLQVCCSIDWDQSAAAVYEANYGMKPLQKDISKLTFEDLEPFHANLWLASPACQPYTVLGLQKQERDPRAQSFLHLMTNVLPEMVSRGSNPNYLLVENVAGFETSTTRNLVLDLLQNLGYSTIEFLLTPKQYGVPNSRLRYYLVARTAPFLSAGDGGTVLYHIPSNPEEPPCSISKYLDRQVDPGTEIPDRILERWGQLFDIVLPSSTTSCCFTRGYTHLIEGAGSILQTNEALQTSTTFDMFMDQRNKGVVSHVQTLHPLGLRFFSPEELLRLFHLSTLAHSFTWPEKVSRKTKYRLIGNSINVAVVSRVMKFLGSDA
ncbi:hypothetical protein FS842_000926 [Serendipita sp. 407]|nr:hypothetical protein FS842_000926 [Serendipita sp. 407]